MSQLRTLTFKVLLLGDGNTGKTTLRKKYMGRKLDEEYLMTMGTEFSSKKVIFEDVKVNLQIWDVAGQKLFAKFRPKYYHDSSGVLILFDLTNKETFERIPMWLKEYMDANQNQLVPIIIIGNKLDLVMNERVMDEDKVQEKIEALREWVKRVDPRNKIAYFETSALDGINVNEVFELLSRYMIELYDEEN